MNGYSLTANDTDVLLAASREVFPYHFPLVFAAPPEEDVDFELIVTDEIGTTGSYILLGSGRPRRIGDSLHSQLLGESLHQHGELWSRLAKR